MAIRAQNDQIAFTAIAKIPVDMLDLNRHLSTFMVNLAPSTPRALVVVFPKKVPSYGFTKKAILC